MTTVSNVQSQAEREAAIKKARKKLLACQDDRRALLAKYPEHTEARRVYDAQIKRLNDHLDALIRGKV